MKNYLSSNLLGTHWQTGPERTGVSPCCWLLWVHQALSCGPAPSFGLPCLPGDSQTRHYPVVESAGPEVRMVPCSHQATQSWGLQEARHDNLRVFSMWTIHITPKPAVIADWGNQYCSLARWLTWVCGWYSYIRLIWAGSREGPGSADPESGQCLAASCLRQDELSPTAQHLQRDKAFC